MKIYPLLLIGILIACSASSGHVSLKAPKNYVEWDVKQFKKQGPLLLYQGNPFSGLVFQIMQGDTVYKAPYLKGKLHGWELDRTDGFSKRYYENGLKEGLHEVWWSNGNKKFEFQFEKGEHHGYAKEWYPNGQLMKHFNYTKGKEDGHQLWYKKDGSIRSNYKVVKGRRFGLVGGKNCQTVYEE